MDRFNLKTILDTVNGAAIVGIDTLTDVNLRKKITSDNTDPTTLRALRYIESWVGKPISNNNPMVGRVQKLTTGSRVMLFTNKNSNGYKNMVERRLKAEGKDPETFKLSKRKWGERIENTPIIRHEKDGEVHYYLEMIYLASGNSSYVIDKNMPIDKEDIYGLPKTKISDDAQAGLENMVITRTTKLSSIVSLRFNSQEFRGEFFYE